MTHQRWQEPLTVGPMTLRHRVGMAPHAVSYGVHGAPSERHVAYYRERARGGVAFLGSEYTNAVRHTSGPYAEMMSLVDDEALAQWRRIADAIHEFDARWIVQLFTPGIHDHGRLRLDHWHPTWAVSRSTSASSNEIPAVVDNQTLADMRADFVRSARNAARAGADAIEIHAAHSYLLGQFLSPAYNRRTDRYGGSIENRARFVVEVAEAIRDELDGHVALGMRLSFDEFLGDAGITPELSEEYLEIFAGLGVLDYFSISCAGHHTMDRLMPPMGAEVDGFLASYGRRAKAVVGDRAKIFLVGKIRTIELAESILRDDDADAILMARALIADPALVRKSEQGNPEDVVRCIGAMDCVRVGGGMVCTVNPAAGREAAWGSGTLRLAPNARSVVVVGGGPAGMRVAAVAAERGHRVTLFEQQSQLGGALNLLKALPTREEWGDAIDDLARPLERRGVDVRLNIAATAATVAEHAPDVVVMCSGSAWDRTGYSGVFRPERTEMPGVGQEHVLDLGTALERVLDDPASLGQRIVVLDESGMHAPLGLAEIMARAGAEVHVISPHAVIGQATWETQDGGALFTRLADLGVQLHPQHFVERVGRDGVVYYYLYGGEPATLQGVDSVVLALLRSPVERLYYELRDGPWELHRIGDALAPREPAEAIYEGDRLGRAL